MVHNGVERGHLLVREIIFDCILVYSVAQFLLTLHYLGNVFDGDKWKRLFLQTLNLRNFLDLKLIIANVIIGEIIVVMRIRPFELIVVIIICGVRTLVTKIINIIQYLPLIHIRRLLMINAAIAAAFIATFHKHNVILRGRFL